MLLSGTEEADLLLGQIREAAASYPYPGELRTYVPSKIWNILVCNASVERDRGQRFFSVGNVKVFEFVEDFD